MSDHSKKWFVNKLLDIIFKYRKTLKLSSTKKSILIQFAYHSNKNGESWPSYQVIAEETGYQRRVIIKHVTEMEDLGIVAIKERYKPSGDRDSNTVKIDLQKIVDNLCEVVIEDHHVVIEDHHGWCSSMQEVVIVDHPNKIIELPKETTQGVFDFLLEENEETKAVEDFVNQVMPNGLFGEH